MVDGITWKPLGVNCDFPECEFEAYQHCNCELFFCWRGCGKAACLHHMILVETPTCAVSVKNVISWWKDCFCMGEDDRKGHIWHCKDEKCALHDFEVKWKWFLRFLVGAIVVYFILKWFVL